jgi:MoxR-like ATPase
MDGDAGAEGMKEKQWRIFRGSQTPHNGLTRLAPPPPWRRSSVHARPELPAQTKEYLEAEKARGKPIQLSAEVQRAINSALVLRRPLLVTGKPGVGKSSLASAVAYELRMGPLLKWPITSRTTVKNGLWEYDAVGRLQSEPNAPMGDFLRLGPLGAALYPTSWPRILLIDEIDKGDIDLPNDLLNVIEDGWFEIPELARAKEEEIYVKLPASSERVPIVHGKVEARQFPFIVMTSNGERDFPAPFLRRCIRITIAAPNPEELTRIVDAHMKQALVGKEVRAAMATLIQDFVKAREKQELATDQLLNAVFVVLGKGMFDINSPERQAIVDLLQKQLTAAAT